MHATKNQTLAVIVFVIGIALVSVGLRAFVLARNTPASSACVNNLCQIDGAKQQWQLETQSPTNAIVTWNDIRSYLGHVVIDGGIPKCPKGGTYILGKVGEKPRCTCGGTLPE